MDTDNKNITIRRAIIDDMQEMQALFVDTIRSTCQKDYSEEQISVWTSSVENQSRWIEKLESQYFLIAETKGRIVGYASLENGNYLDFMYVHKDFMRQGIAINLYKALEKESKRKGVSTISSDVSITAKPFFEKIGFISVKENKNVMKGIEIINYQMRKDI